MKLEYGLKLIKNKNVYIKENHNEVLEGWAEYRQSVSNAPFLITLDHHTDIHSAFLHYTYNQKSGNIDSELQKRLVNSISYSDKQSIEDATMKLRNDEHIDAAIKSKIISKAFAISYSSSKDDPSSYKEKHRIDNIHINMERAIDGLPDLEYIPSESKQEYPDSDIFVIGNCCSIGCEGPHNDDCTIPHFNQAIESIFIKDKLDKINRMCPSLIKGNVEDKDYILDIDLDYFHTIQSINPNDTKEFYKLIRNAKLITIATEPTFVEMWKIDYEYDLNISSQVLLEKLLNHIDAALKE